MKKILLLSNIFLFLAFSLFSLDWPKKGPIVTRSFGVPDIGEFVSSVSITSRSDEVFAIAEGRIVYKRPGTDVSPSLLIIEHANGLRSVYRGLNILDFEDSVIEKGQLIGKGLEISLEISDPVSGQFFNPETLLPKLTDKKAPRVVYFGFMQNDKLYEISNDKKFFSGDAEFLLICEDIRGDKLLSPYSIAFYIDGLRQKEYVFDSLSYNGKEYLFLWAPSFGSIVKRIDDKSYFSFGKTRLLPGEVKLEIYIKDINGNQTEAAYSIIVSRPD